MDQKQEGQEKVAGPDSGIGSFYDEPLVKLRHSFFFLGARARRQHGPSVNGAAYHTFETGFQPTQHFFVPHAALTRAGAA
jgi:hypothetical protein